MEKSFRQVIQDAYHKNDVSGAGIYTLAFVAAWFGFKIVLAYFL